MNDLKVNECEHECFVKKDVSVYLAIFSCSDYLSPQMSKTLKIALQSRGIENLIFIGSPANAIFDIGGRCSIRGEYDISIHYCKLTEDACLDDHLEVEDTGIPRLYVFGGKLKLECFDQDVLHIIHIKKAPSS